MTVPQDAVMCFGMGLAARAAVPAVVCRSRQLRRTWSAGFAAGWVPVSCGLLLVWPEWSWWEAGFIADQPALALPLALGLQCIAFVGGLAMASRAGDRWFKATAWGALIGWVVASGIGWSQFSLVSRPSSGLPAEPLWFAWDLLTFLGIGGAWMLWVGWVTVRRTSGIGPQASPASGGEAASP